MMREIEYPATRLPRILEQMHSEKNENLINTVFGATYVAKSAYLPAENVKPFNKSCADFFLKKANQE